jgi:hypothetical protein
MCSLTQGYTLGCKGIGGIHEVYIFDGIESITEEEGVITELTVSGNMYLYELQRSTASFSDKIERLSTGAKVYNIELNFVLNTMLTSVRNEVRRLIKHRINAIVKDRNGVYWLLGRENGLKNSSGKASPGQAASDRSGFELSFEGTEKQPVIEVAASAIEDAIEEVGYYILTETGDYILQETGDKIYVE